FVLCSTYILFFFSSRRRHTRFSRDWSSDVCSSDLKVVVIGTRGCQPVCLWSLLLQPRVRRCSALRRRLESCCSVIWTSASSAICIMRSRISCSWPEQTL